MRYFLVIGLMLMSSFAQADICIPLWWKSATVFQIELEAELKGPFAMNIPCEDGRLPIELALENRTYPPAFAAIMENFELDGRARYQLRTIAGMQLQQAYEELASRAEPVFGPVAESDETESARDPGSSGDIDIIDIIVQLMKSDPRIMDAMNNEDIFDNINISRQINKRDYINFDINDIRRSISRDIKGSLSSDIVERLLIDRERREAEAARRKREREAYNQSLEEYRTRLAIYKIIVPSE